jgi:hypothetical protein
VIDAQSDRQTTLTGLGSLRPYSGLTIKQGHLGTDNSTRGEQKGEQRTKGDGCMGLTALGTLPASLLTHIAPGPERPRRVHEASRRRVDPQLEPPIV